LQNQLIKNILKVSALLLHFLGLAHWNEERWALGMYTTIAAITFSYRSSFSISRSKGLFIGIISLVAGILIINQVFLIRCGVLKV